MEKYYEVKINQFGASSPLIRFFTLKEAIRFARTACKSSGFSDVEAIIYEIKDDQGKPIIAYSGKSARKHYLDY